MGRRRCGSVDNIVSNSFRRYLIQAFELRACVMLGRGRHRVLRWLRRSIEQDVVWDVGLGLGTGDDVAPRRGRDHNRLAPVDIYLKPRLLLPPRSCDVTERVFLLALDRPTRGLVGNVLLRLVGASAHHDGLLVDLHRRRRGAEDELVLIQNGPCVASLVSVVRSVDIFSRLRGRSCW